MSFDSKTDAPAAVDGELLSLIPDYLLGALSEEQECRVAALIERSPGFRREVDAAAEALAGAAVALEPAAPPASVRSRLLATVAGVDRFAPFFDDLVALFELPLGTIKRLLARIDEPSAAGTARPAWETTLLGVALQGAELFHFPVGPRLAAAGGAGGVLRVRPDVTFPRHSHHGREITYVLEGGYIADGHRHGPGSRVEVAGDAVHDYRAAPGRDLVLMVLHHGIEMLPGR